MVLPRDQRVRMIPDMPDNMSSELQGAIEAAYARS